MLLHSQTSPRNRASYRDKQPCLRSIDCVGNARPVRKLRRVRMERKSSNEPCGSCRLANPQCPDLEWISVRDASELRPGGGNRDPNGNDHGLSTLRIREFSNRKLQRKLRTLHAHLELHSLDLLLQRRRARSRVLRNRRQLQRRPRCRLARWQPDCHVCTARATRRRLLHRRVLRIAHSSAMRRLGRNVGRRGLRVRRGALHASWTSGPL